MQRSSERILTTHVGSLARPHDLLEVMREKEHGRPYDPARFTEMVTEAVRDVVRRQAEAGLDVVTDGEMGKVSFLTYVKERLAGFDQVEGETLLPPSWQREIDDGAAVVWQGGVDGGSGSRQRRQLQCRA